MLQKECKEHLWGRFLIEIEGENDVLTILCAHCKKHFLSQIADDAFEKFLDNEWGKFMIESEAEIKKSVDDLLDCGIAISKTDGDKTTRIDSLSKEGMEIQNKNVYNAENFENN